MTRIIRPYVRLSHLNHRFGQRCGWAPNYIVSSGGGSAPFLVIAAGESNSGGFAPNASASAGELVERPQLQFWNVDDEVFEPLYIGTNNNLDHIGLNSTTHGIELELANIVASGRFTGDTVYYLQTGQGASNIQDWLTGSVTGFWTKFINRYNAASAAISGGFVPVVFYSQGINDAIGNNFYGGAGATTDADTWKTRTIAHLEKIRDLVGETTLIVMTKFRSNRAAFNTVIDEIAASDEYTVAIQTDDDPDVQWQVDGNHWSYRGMKELCNRFVDQIFAEQSIAPAILPVSGTYGEDQDVTISGENVRYSINGIDPHTGTVYTGGFTATPPVTVLARAYQPRKKSTLASVDYLAALSTWNTADATAGSLTLSNANLDIVQSNSAWKTCKVSSTRSAGKYYCEFRCEVEIDNAFQMIGACTPSYSVSSHLFASSGGCCVWVSGFATGGGFTAGTGTNSYAPFPNLNDVFAVAIDFDAGKLWIAKNNTYMGGSPSAGTDPQFTFLANTELAAAMAFFGDKSRWRVLSATVNQVYSPPSGFIAWG